MAQVLATVLACLSSLLLGRLAIAAAPRLRFLDPPGARKLQARPVPVLGGAAIFLGLLLGVAPGLAGPERFLLGRWLTAGAWLLALGMVDDRRGLGPLARLVGQLLAALLFLPELSAWLGPDWVWPARAIGLLWLLGLINAFNFLDNMDGAAASTAFWTALALGLSLATAGGAALADGLWPLAGALLGFLWWNRPPARLYMGDAGATCLGFSLGLFALLAVGRASLSPWLAPLFLAVPLYDTASVCWIRWREGRPLWVGDRRHATHRLLARGAGIGRTLATINVWTLAAAALALGWGERGAAWLPLGAALALALGVFGWERNWERRRAAAGEPPRRG
ncbi:undecaprenyl/decaprenyl-phosphate alpha-N-acetylglucosaminyl 1-phosphate transferase [bacterium]|nr:undecaprenyl/decaprenyl-phosphate alpha-N-acetylglucosaminyl 1-phosphate transferase [bacterium]